MKLPHGAEDNPRLVALEHQSQQWPSTQLGVGVVSLNVVDAAVELAQEHDVSIMLVASRRQVDAAELGGGYVAGLTPEALVERVRSSDRRGRVLVCRDHGGPWQGSNEMKESTDKAMAEAKTSFAADIDAGFDILHVDTSLDMANSSDVIRRDRLLELYDWCWNAAKSQGRAIAFEIGDEEQANVIEGLDQPRPLLEALEGLQSNSGAPPPLFVVAQTGTKVMERRNVGSLSAPYRIDGQMPSRILLAKVSRLLNDHQTHLKQHNTDYLTTEVLSWHPLLDIHAANVAPEYGIEETLGLLSVMEERGATDLSEEFLSLAYETHKWDKWEMPDSEATDRERAIWAGHYVFSAPEFQDIREHLLEKTGTTGEELDSRVRSRIRTAIRRHLKAFRVIS